MTLLSKTFSDLGLTKKSVISATSECTLENALKMMVFLEPAKTAVLGFHREYKQAQNNVLTLPITSRAFPDRFVYVLSTLDILMYLVARRKHGVLNLAETVESAMTMDAEMESYRVFERDYRDTIEATMVKFSQGLHRALITDALKQKPPMVLTQSDIVQYIHKNHASIIIPALAKTVKELGLIQGSVRSLLESETAITGFSRMATHKILALPVVDKAGLVIATLSASDVRGLSTENLAYVDLNVMEFLQKMKPKTTNPTSSLSPEDTLLDAINMIVERDVHRLWILDSMLRPIGVVSQSDIIAAILGVSAQKAN